MADEAPVIVFFDTETLPIRPGRQAPRVVCVQSRESGIDRIDLREPGLDRLEAWLRDPRVMLVGHNTAFDVLATSATRPRLWRLWLDAYSADRVTCTYERERLIRIADGSLFRYKSHALDVVATRYKIAVDYDGLDDVRLTYHTLDGVPVDTWPEAYRRYALQDLVVSEIYTAQERHARYLEDQYRQARGALWLAYTSAWGMRVDGRAAEAYAEILEREHEETRRALVGAGLVRPDGSKDTKAAARRLVAVYDALRLPAPRTEKGCVSLDADATGGTGDPVLEAYSRYTSIGTLRSRVERLRLADRLGVPVQPRFETVLETGRTSASTGGKLKPGKPISRIGDSSQNLARAPGLRECYRARPGCVLISVDWRAAELHTLAQTCLDLGLGSRLAEVLNSGQDVHLWFGARMRGLTYEQASKHPDKKTMRQAAKAANFGFPGGLGIAKFRMFAAATYGVILSESEAQALKAAWLDAFPEMRGYFNGINALIESGEPLKHLRSNRYRKTDSYCAAANSFFQGRAADMLKDAGWRLTLEIADGLECRSWNEAHDEILVEAPEARAHEVAIAVREIMRAAGRVWCPDVPPDAEPAICRSWRKGAEPTYSLDGRLIPWEDRELTPDEITKIRASSLSPIHTSWIVGITEEKCLSLLSAAS